MGIVERLLFIYLTDTLGGSVFLCGLTVGVTVVIELPIFYYAERLMNRYIARVCITDRVFVEAILKDLLFVSE